MEKMVDEKSWFGADRGRTACLWSLFAVYFYIGLTGFSHGVVSEMKRQLVRERNLLGAAEFDSGLALSQMLPGATYVSLAVFTGYRILGVPGALVSFFAFLLAPLVIVILLSQVYFAYGALPLFKMVFKGLTISVVALVAHAWTELCKPVVANHRGLFIMAAAVAATLTVQPNVFLLLTGGAVAGIVLSRREPAGAQDKNTANLISNCTGLNTFKARLTLSVLLAGLLFACAAVDPLLSKLVSVFFRMGLFLFGGGSAILPFIQQEVVASQQWLTLDEFMVGIALGQITPGPILVISAFVGYKLAGVAGALAAAMGMFLPSFLVVLTTAEAHRKIQHLPYFQAAVRGIIAVFAGLVGIVAIELIRYALTDWKAIALAVATYYALRTSKINTIWIVLAGAMVYWLMV